MRRLRFFRILLPALLLLLIVALFYSVKPRPSAHTTPQMGDGADTERLENVEVTEYKGTERTLAGHAAVAERGEDGRLRLQEIKRLEIAREGRGPLVVSASRGEGVGDVGQRVWEFDGSVLVADPAEELELRLPGVQVDEKSRVARATGEIHFGGPGVEGRAGALLYGLEGPPRELTQLELTDSSGRRLTAVRAILLDGMREIELEGPVWVTSADGGSLSSQRMRLSRSTDQRLRHVVASDGVSGDWPLGGVSSRLRGRRLEADWDEQEAPRRVLLEGEAGLDRGTQSLTAEAIEAVRNAEGWNVRAGPTVHIQGNLLQGPGLLRSDRLEADFDPTLRLIDGTATGHVSFEGNETRAEAETARFSATGAGELQLFGDERSKARLARGRTRVAGNHIRTDPRGERVEAEGRVEATLLPAGGSGEGGKALGLFESGQAVHFVSARLESTSSGSLLVFRGSVRGWQGERNLAADEIQIHESDRRLEAHRNVSTRMPRERSGRAVGEADFLQVAADHLRYDDASGQAVYEGHVRLSLVEGWLEAEHLEVKLAGEGRRTQEVRARGGVRMEFHQLTGAGPARVISGQGDRLEYEPATETVRLFGDQAPATVRRISEGGGTTSGRVLRYRLDLGTLEVSGERGDARIRTP